MSVKGIAFSGKQGAGKTTAKKAAKDLLEQYGFHVYEVNFADALKIIVRAALQAVPTEYVGTTEQHYRVPVAARANVEDWKYEFRPSLQAAGTAGREQVYENIWVDIAINKMRSILASDPLAFVLNDDCRYPNEIDALSGISIATVRLEASRQLRLSRVPELKGEDHPSETGLDGHAFDLVIDQDAHPATPAASAEAVLKELGILPTFAGPGVERRTA